MFWVHYKCFIKLKLILNKGNGQTESPNANKTVKRRSVSLINSRHKGCCNYIHQIGEQPVMTDGGNQPWRLRWVRTSERPLSSQPPSVCSYRMGKSAAGFLPVPEQPACFICRQLGGPRGPRPVFLFIRQDGGRDGQIREGGETDRLQWDSSCFL